MRPGPAVAGGLPIPWGKPQAHLRPLYPKVPLTALLPSPASHSTVNDIIPGIVSSVTILVIIGIDVFSMPLTPCLSLPPHHPQHLLHSLIQQIFMEHPLHAKCSCSHWECNGKQNQVSALRDLPSSPSLPPCKTSSMSISPSAAAASVIVH